MSPLLITAAFVAFTIVVVWKFGYGLARIAGIVLVLKGLVWLVAGAAVGAQLGAMAAGTAVWLTGHLFGAYRHRTWGSRLAKLIFTRIPGLRVLDPQRRKRQSRRPTRPEPGRRVPGDDWTQWESELDEGSPHERKVPKTSPRQHHRSSRIARIGSRVARSAACTAVRLTIRHVPAARAAHRAYRFLR
ncbi:hypothetical protein CJ179_00040 [Rhodococcus sp. ACS1]|uniref:hypothetical protein n=1 Tax=Rhodococcus sp. ACS1 TaxID=2028570 RepID=UPI000BB0E266|nr:hypothetical protein [Rhodococcus sp. ACS1]PBC51858.1 hypothetical protein CJ179_00040 [Rhodococcus sp. ACS1]